MQIRVALLADSALSKRAKKLALELSRLSKSYFAVDGKKLKYHITLFDILPLSKEIPAVAKAMKGFVAHDTAMGLRVSGVWNKSIHGYLGLKIKHSKQLLGFRERLFKALKNFGPQEVGTKYNPHITLTRYRDVDFPHTIKIKDPLKGNFGFRYVVLARVDKHGQVYKVIKKFKFK